MRTVSTGGLQEAPSPHWQGRWGEVWCRGQGAEGRQGGKGPLTLSQHQQPAEGQQTNRAFPAIDWRPEDQSGGPERCEKTRSEEGSYVCWLNAAGSAGLQTQGDHGLEVQPEAGEEGGERGGEFKVVFDFHIFSK